MRKNILYTIDTCGSGGAETIFLELINGLDTKKYSPYVILNGKGWLYDEVVKLGLYPEVVKMGGSFNVPYLLHIFRIIKQNKIDLVHSHLFGSNLYCSIVGIICKIPIISTFHGTVDSNLSGRMLRLKFSLINRGSQYIVFVSDHLKNHYLAHTPVDSRRCITIYNGIDCNRFAVSKNDDLRRELGLAQDEILIGSIGNIRDAKGYDVLLKSAAIITKKFPQCRFIVAGEGHGRLYQEILDMREKLDIARNVTFLGFRTDTEKILNSLYLFVLPSLTEGFSISTVEAMAAGVPVVVTDSGGPGEIVKHMKDGVLVEAKNPESLAKGIELCLKDPDLCSTLTSNARETARRRFTIEKMLKEYSELYNIVL